MVHIFARTLNAAFSSASDLTTADWDQLERDCNEWNSTKPWTFTPLPDASSTNQRNEAFPMIWMLRPAYVAGNQHYCMAKIMLATCNPRTPKSGFGAFKARGDEEVRDPMGARRFSQVYTQESLGNHLAKHPHDLRISDQQRPCQRQLPCFPRPNGVRIPAP
jgi:hypothetical protein